MATPERFQVSRGTLAADRFMDRTIRLGGAAVILAVFGIMVFVVSQVLPLFRGAKVSSLLEFPTGLSPSNRVQLLGADEWMEAPFLVAGDGTFSFFHLAYPASSRSTAPVLMQKETVRPEVFSSGVGATAFEYNQELQTVAMGSADGRLALLELRYTADFSGEKRSVRHQITPSLVAPIGRPGAPVEAISFGGDGNRKLVAVIQKGPKGREIHVRSYKKAASLEGDAAIEPGRDLDLTAQLPAAAVNVLVKKQADGLLVMLEGGLVAYLTLDEEIATLRQSWKPFEDQGDSRIGTAEFVFGDVSVSFVSASGVHRIFSLYARPDRENQRLFGQTKTLAPLSSAAGWTVHSARNKALLTGEGRKAALTYTTTESIRWSGELPAPMDRGLIGGKFDRLLFLGNDQKLYLYDLEDRHPEVSWKAFFGKIWYEGSEAPKYEWQSTGGTDDFEPKLSLVPLIIGTLKGTFYALLFAIPVALFAALYASQFLHPSLKGYVKPIMELMASLPSVVLGFLAALFIAPLVETRIPSLLLIFIFAPSAALLFGTIWSRQSVTFRSRIPAGWEFIAFAPLFFAAVIAGWQLGPLIERLVFTVADADGGARVADFRLWFTQATGLPFDQRNSLVVGFIMGFAVMPILFTIAEDAFSNVPESMRSGALALGASRWQTAIHVVLPTAMAGLFSAVMVAFGRAVGETMIVVMATGNTPVMDFNIFSGMRTLSANIAVELPEAPEGGTLYRALFLGALVLFLMTFVLNTFAEILRQRLREKYKNA